MHNATIVADPFSITQRQREIPQITLSAAGYINQELHDEFWNEFDVPELGILKKANEKKRYTAIIEKVMVDAIRFQYATWKSVEQSIKAGKVVYHPDYLAAKAKMAELNTPDVRRSLANGDLVIRSAIEKTAVPTPAGLTYITPESVELVLNNLETTLERARLLFAYEWKPTNKEYVLKKAHMKAISPLPFAYMKNAYEDGDLVEHVYFASSSPVAGTSATWLSVGVPIEAPDEALQIFASEALKYYGVDEGDIFPLKSSWRGYKAFKGSGTGYLNETKTHIDLLTIWRDDLEGVLQLSGMSEKSLFEATRTLIEFEHQIQLTN